MNEDFVMSEDYHVYMVTDSKKVLADIIETQTVLGRAERYHSMDVQVRVDLATPGCPGHGREPHKKLRLLRLERHWNLLEWTSSRSSFPISKVLAPQKFAEVAHVLDQNLVLRVRKLSVEP